MLDFLKKLGNKQAIGDMIRGGIVAGATPNIAGGGATDVLRGMQAGMYDRDARLAQNDELLMKAQKLDQFYDKLRQDAELARQRNETSRYGADTRAGASKYGADKRYEASSSETQRKGERDAWEELHGAANVQAKGIPNAMVYDWEAGSFRPAQPGEKSDVVQSRQDYLDALIEQAQATAGSTRANTELLGDREARAQQLADAATKRADASMVSAGASSRRADAGGSGRPLSDSAIKYLAEIEAPVQRVMDLQGVVDQNAKMFGPMAGRMAAVPYLGAESQKIQAQLDLIKQLVGKAFEGGVLRKEDEIKYERILPRLTDLPDVAKEKIRLAHQALSQHIKRYRDYQQASGRNVPDMTGQSAAQPTGQPAAPGHVEIELPDGTSYEVPESEAQQWLQDFPGAKVVQ